LGVGAKPPTPKSPIPNPQYILFELITIKNYFYLCIKY